MATAARAALQQAQAVDYRYLRNWFVCWILLPTLPFLPLWFLGGPPPYLKMMIAGVIGLLARRAHYITRLGTFIIVISILTLHSIAALFNLAFSSLLMAVRFLVEMDPMASPEYLFGGLLFVFTLLLGAVLLRLPAAFETPRALLGAVLVLAPLCGVNARLPYMASYAPREPMGAPFSSATSQSGLIKLADGRTHVLVVMVEAMGLPTDPLLKRRFAELWARPEFKRHHVIRTGQTPFFGSTTNAEIRELCGRWGGYADLPKSDPTCLPARLAKAGYQNRAIHSFEGAMFDRLDWYPKIGFRRMMFRPELLARGASVCPGVFPGACDHQIPALISHDLRAAKAPQFTYWLTLNSHLPVAETDELPTADCAQQGLVSQADHPMVCRLFSLWGDVAHSLAAMVAEPGFPPTHILIVGDHVPPFFDKASRTQFDPGQVPWILLEYKPD